MLQLATPKGLTNYRTYVKERTQSTQLGDKRDRLRQYNSDSSTEVERQLKTRLENLEGELVRKKTEKD